MPEDRLREYQGLADNGDPDAQLSLAWEYFYVRRDSHVGLRFFCQAELRKPGLARYYLAKAKILLNDNTFKNEIPDHYIQGFGPAFYLMGAAKKKGILCEANFDEAFKYFLLAKQDNHLVSEFFVWRLQKKSIFEWIVTFPWSACLCIRIIRIRIRNPNDVRVLM